MNAVLKKKEGRGEEEEEGLELSSMKRLYCQCVWVAAQLMQSKMYKASTGQNPVQFYHRHISEEGLK